MNKIKTNEACPRCGIIKKQWNINGTNIFIEEVVNYLDKEFWGGIDWHYTCSKCGYSEIKEEIEVMVKAA
jgi:predicted nucleic-acid-binding Zn-ribbon protein